MNGHESFADRLSKLTRLLAAQDSPLALGLWERGGTIRIGKVTKAIKDVSRRIEDGYQYVGGFPAHMWRLATADPSYKTLQYGIVSFPRRWNELKHEISSPMHYVSIGPGTGEKDAAILKHLQTLADSPIVYIPVDISADLLRMSLDVSLQEIDEGHVDVLPIELDVASERGLQGLKQVIEQMTHGPVLISLLGNTLANFREDEAMLKDITELLSGPDDLLLMELATTREATKDLALKAGSEYNGSVSFSNFVMAALTQYTNCTHESGSIVHKGQVIDGAIEIRTRFTASEPLMIYVNDTDHFELEVDDGIELYRSRKYTPESLDRLFSDLVEVKKEPTPFSKDFGVVTSLLRLKSAADVGRTHFVAGK